jgi:outer membrane immunogenic protein
MRKIAIAAATLAALFAAPAFAQSSGASGEGRVEVRGGIAWAGGAEEAFAGAAAGYDFDLGDTTFVGIEAAADKVLVDGSEIFFTGAIRAGAKTGANGKVYVLGGYGFTDGAGDGAFAGLGYQHKFGSNFYGKVEYRRTLVSGTDINFAGVGLGVSF